MVDNNVTKRQHDVIHQAISCTSLNEQECYDALWSYLTWLNEIKSLQMWKSERRNCWRIQDYAGGRINRLIMRRKHLGVPLQPFIGERQ